MTKQKDSSAILSEKIFDWSGRIKVDSDGNELPPVIDWSNRKLVDVKENFSINWDDISFLLSSEIELMRLLNQCHWLDFSEKRRIKKRILHVRKLIELYM